MKNPPIIFLISILLILQTPNWNTVFGGDTCRLSYRLEFQLYNGTTITAIYPEERIILVNSTPIPLYFDDALKYAVSKISDAKVVRDIGYKLIIYNNTLHFLARINNSLIDLYYDSKTRILVLASQTDEDLILLLQEKSIGKPCTTTQETTTTTTSITTTPTTYTSTTSTNNATSNRSNNIGAWIIPVTILAVAVMVSILILLTRGLQRNNVVSR